MTIPLGRVQPLKGHSEKIDCRRLDYLDAFLVAPFGGTGRTPRLGVGRSRDIFV